MSTGQPEPTRDQLLAMAYVDDELESAARAEFEGRLAAEPALRLEVAQLRELELLARAAAPRELMDHEWEALARDPAQRGALGLGWVLVAVGVLGIAVYGLCGVFLAASPLPVRLCLGALLIGGVLLLGATLRARLRTLPLDPYRKVKR